MAGSLNLTREQLAKITGGDPRAIKALEAFFSALANLGTHAPTHEPGGSDPLTVDAAAAVGSLRTLGAGAAQAAAGNDARLSDYRAPTAHAGEHEAGGGDELDVAALGGFPGGATNYLREDGTWAPPTAAPVLHVREVQAYNVDGGTFTAGADQTRVLNTVVLNEITGASLASNQITLPVGTYDIEWSTPAYNVGNNWSWLYNATAAANIPGVTAVSYAAAASYSSLTGHVRVVLSVTSALEVRHRCTVTRATDGFGVHTSVAGYDSIYTDVFVTKVA